MCEKLGTFDNSVYKIIPGKDKYNHYFGGETWEAPTCRNCNKPMLQIFTFDLNDRRIGDVFSTNLTELPLFSCLDCSLIWGEQVFQIQKETQEVVVLEQNDTTNWVCEESLKQSYPLPKVDVKLELIDSLPPYDEDSYYEELDRFDSDYACRLLGTPLILQGDFDISCPKCRENMVHLATISGDSYEKSSFKTDFFIGEMYVYFMFCNKCNIIKSFCQGS
jgi:hypothetical protein